MNIVIIGAGKIGATLTEQLLREGHEITVVDTRTAALDAIGNTLDVMTVEGNGISMDTQIEAGVPSADLVIAVMSTDEQNLLSCLIAKRLGVGNTIARVRNPEYTSGLHLIQDDLGLSMALNPELASATEIARILRAPASIKIDTFSKGRVELHKMRIDPGSILDGMKLSAACSPARLCALWSAGSTRCTSPTAASPCWRATASAWWQARSSPQSSSTRSVCRRTPSSA